MPNCANCGEPISEHAAFCSNCRTPVAVGAGDRKSAPRQQSPAPVDLPDNREGFDLGLLLSANGRIGRKDYWIILIGSFALGLVWGIVYDVVDPTNQSAADRLLAIAGLVLLIATFVVGTLTAIKRLHDLGHSGWVLLVTFLPLANFVLLFIFLFISGSSVVNRYGEPNSGSPFPRLH